MLGLSEENLEKLAQDTSAIKTSRRDLPYVISKVLFFLTCGYLLLLSILNLKSSLGCDFVKEISVVL